MPTNDEETILEAEFTETETDTGKQPEDAGEAQTPTLVVPGLLKPLDPRSQTDEKSAGSIKTVAYAIAVLAVVGFMGLYLRGLYLAT